MICRELVSLEDHGGLMASSVPFWARGTWGHGVLSAEAGAVLHEIIERPWSLWQWSPRVPAMFRREVAV